ncbi:MAG: retroviral-like aspartic protease [Candidatus Levybacteria bacterium]|nr:retroviral-like aspartic protease [Candidatus Levybacteria bacterium]
MSKFPYTALPTASGIPVLKPLVGIRLGFKKTHKITPKILALIDSGADVCFCDSNIALWLGVNFKNKKTFGFTAADNQTFQAVKETIALYVDGKEYECDFYFSDTLPRHTPIILGQKGFFDHFKVSFDLKNNEIELQ